MATSRLDELPAELKLIILRSSPSLQCLHNLIRASSSFSRLYFRATQGVLSDVLCNLLGKEGLSDALAALYAERLGNCDVDRAMMKDFLTRWSEGWAHDYTQTGLPLDVSVWMSRLLESIEHLVAAFTAETLDRLKTLTSHLQTGSLKPESNDYRLQNELLGPPSTAETARLHRAFLLLHTYARLFFGNLSSEEQSYANPLSEVYQDLRAVFLRRFVALGVEELACVYDCCRQALARKFVQVEDCFMQSKLAERSYKIDHNQSLQAWRNPPAYQVDHRTPAQINKIPLLASEDDLSETPNCFQGRNWIFSRYASTKSLSINREPHLQWHSYHLIYTQF